MSVQPCEDEMESDKHMNIYYDEFVEALTRCAEVLSLVPYGESNHLLWGEVRRIE
jgi:hypothetical protein